MSSVSLRAIYIGSSDSELEEIQKELDIEIGRYQILAHQSAHTAGSLTKEHQWALEKTAAIGNLLSERRSERIDDRANSNFYAQKHFRVQKLTV